VISQNKDSELSVSINIISLELLKMQKKKFDIFVRFHLGKNDNSILKLENSKCTIVKNAGSKLSSHGIVAQD